MNPYDDIPPAVLDVAEESVKAIAPEVNEWLRGVAAEVDENVALVGLDPFRLFIMDPRPAVEVGEGYSVNEIVGGLYYRA